MKIEIQTKEEIINLKNVATYETSATNLLTIKMKNGTALIFREWENIKVEGGYGDFKQPTETEIEKKVKEEFGY